MQHQFALPALVFLISPCVCPSSLTALNISDNFFDEVGCYMLRQWSNTAGAGCTGLALERNTSLSSLDISKNRISDSEIDGFIQGLQLNHTLSIMHVGDHLIGGKMRIIAELDHHSVSTFSRLPSIPI